MAEINTKYHRKGNDTPIDIVIKNSISYPEMSHIINTTVEHMFDEIGNYTPFEGEVIMWGLILNLFTDIDRELVSTNIDVYELINNSDIVDVVVSTINDQIKTMVGYVSKMVDAKMHESPIKPLLKMFAAFSDKFTNEDAVNAMTEALQNENIVKLLAKQ